MQNKVQLFLDKFEQELITVTGQRIPDTWNWFLPLTKKQANKLKAGLDGYFRFYGLKMTYSQNVFSVKLPQGTTDPQKTLNEIGIYINGFSHAIFA